MCKIKNEGRAVQDSGIGRHAMHELIFPHRHIKSTATYIKIASEKEQKTRWIAHLQQKKRNGIR